MQLAFLHLFESINRDTEIQNPRAWLYRVVHNFAIDGLRQVRNVQKITYAGTSNTKEKVYCFEPTKQLVQVCLEKIFWNLILSLCASLLLGLIANAQKSQQCLINKRN